MVGGWHRLGRWRGSPHGAHDWLHAARQRVRGLPPARFAANEDPNYLLQQVAQRCRQFGVRFIGADGGGSGFHLNRLLVKALFTRRAINR